MKCLGRCCENRLFHRLFTKFQVLFTKLKISRFFRLRPFFIGDLFRVLLVTFNWMITPYIFICHSLKGRGTTQECAMPISKKGMQQKNKKPTARFFSTTGRFPTKKFGPIFWVRLRISNPSKPANFWPETCGETPSKKPQEAEENDDWTNFSGGDV